MNMLLDNIKEFLKKMPVLHSLGIKALYAWAKIKFPGSSDYWIVHYKKGGNSGLGSYDILANYKAEILNEFVKKNNILTVIEYGCGDGNQLKLAEYPQYIGFDISPTVISHCKKIFMEDQTKSFKMVNEYAGEIAELTLSLDVIFHLIEDDVFEKYIKRLFGTSTRYVVIYSSNRENQDKFQDPTVRHRMFTDFVDAYISDWELIEHIPNKYPYQGDAAQGSFSEFFIYKRK